VAAAGTTQIFDLRDRKGLCDVGYRDCEGGFAILEGSKVVVGSER
jgi:hypothetical protein